MCFCGDTFGKEYRNMGEKSKKRINFMYPKESFSPSTAYLFGVLNQHCENKMLQFWQISNFINPCIDINLIDPDIPDDPLVYVDFFRKSMWYGCPFIKSIDFELDYVRSKWEKNFVEFVIECIDLGYLVYADINKKYIPNYKSPHDFTHNLLVTGYDKVEKTVEVADYFFNRQFSIQKCSFSNLNRSFLELRRIEDHERFSKVNILKYKDNLNYKFCIDEIVTKLKDYMDSTDLTKKHYYVLFAFEYRNAGKLYYGLQYYDALKILIKEERVISTKPLQLLYAHKLIMRKRLELLFSEQYISDKSLLLDNENLVRKTLVLRNFILKISIRDDVEKIVSPKEKERILYLLDELQNLDFKFVEKMVNVLSKLGTGHF